MFRRLTCFAAALLMGAALVSIAAPIAVAYDYAGDSAPSDDTEAIPNPPEVDPDPSAPPVDDVDAWDCNPWVEVCHFDGGPLAANAITVSRTAIVDYAQTYVGSLTNPRSSVGYNRAFPVFRDNDCQNFVSQALLAGGWPMSIGWFFNSRVDYSTSWPAVLPFMRYAQNSGRGVYVKYWSRVSLGDVVMVDWNGWSTPPNYMHSMIVTRLDGVPGDLEFDIRLTYHTNNRLDKSLRSLQATNPNATWWAFHLYTSF